MNRPVCPRGECWGLEVGDRCSHMTARRAAAVVAKPWSGGRRTAGAMAPRRRDADTLVLLIDDGSGPDGLGIGHNRTLNLRAQAEARGAAAAEALRVLRALHPRPAGPQGLVRVATPWGYVEI